MKGETGAFWALGGPAIVTASALLSACLILIFLPLLARYAMARPNARSSHKIPTAQGGGFAIVVTVIVVSYATFFFLPPGAAAMLQFQVVSAAVVLIAGVGVIADIHPENVGSRLLLQTFSVAAMVFTLPSEIRVLPILPLPIERIGLVLSALWFVNLVNFMDGLDWMTVAEVVPITGALGIIGLLGFLPPPAVVVSFALCGALIGFAFFNRPVAKLFLGDVGSLPIGLLLGWLLVLLAGSGGRAAAILLPLYYVTDSTTTLVRRALNGERIWNPHRAHFYQRATDNGFSVSEVVARVFVVNLTLCALAIATVLIRGWLIALAALLVGAVLVVRLLAAFARPRR